MVRAIRGLVTVVGVLLAGAAAAQPPAPLPIPTQPPPGAATVLPPPSAVAPPVPDPSYQYGPPSLVYPPPADGPTLIVPGGPKPGVFGAADLGLLFPHVSQSLAATVLVQPFGLTDLIRLPSAEMDVAVAPKFTLGYRFRDDLGAILLTYQNIASEGNATIPNYDPLGDGLLRSRLDMNVITLAYATREMPLGALWSLQWEAGARLATIFFDSQAQGQMLGEQFSNHFVGAGPMVALNVTRELPPSGLALYGRAEFADLLGHVQQRFATNVFDQANPGAIIGFGSSENGGGQGVPQLGLQLGLSWLSQPAGHYRLTAGYQFDHYWAVGKLGTAHGDVMAQGLFFRTEFNY